MTEYRFYREDGTYDVVPPEPWCWVAQYLDGTVLSQFDTERQLFHQFREIQQDKLKAFSVIPAQQLGLRPITIMWGPGRKLIHFYRNVRLNVGTPTESFMRLICFGFEERGVKTIMVITPHGEVIVVDDMDKIQVA